MKKIDFHFLPRRLRLWLPPLIGIPAMLALGIWGGNTANFLLFTHHLFWFVGIILLYHPLTETFWPSSAQSHREKARFAPSQRIGAARHQAIIREKMAQASPPSASEPPLERLAQLQKRKEALDRKIEKLATRSKKHGNKRNRK